MINLARSSKFIDVSVRLSPDTPIWPGVPPLKLRQTKTTLSCGEIMLGSRIDLSVHSGTHIDAPLHFACRGMPIDALSLDAFVGPCRVYEHTGEGHITKRDLDAMGFMPGKRILLKTKNSLNLKQGILDEHFLSLMPDAIDHLIRSKVEVLGVDGLSIGPYGELTNTNHVKFCQAGGVIIEVLDLSEVEPGEYLMIALPLRLTGLEASPVRVVLIRPEDVADVFHDD